MKESDNINTSRNGGGIGVGSASIVLIFAVLCLTTFSLIAYIVASNNKAIVDAETELVTGYYEADALAERIMLEVETLGIVPMGYDSGNETIGIIALYLKYDEQLDTDIAFFHVPILNIEQNEISHKSLYVSFAENGGSFDILSWRMVDTDEWQADGSVNVWTGD